MTGLPAKGAAYQTLIADRTFIVIDTETTTVQDADGNDQTHLVSLGAVVLLNGTRRDVFHTLIDPGVPVDEASSAYNGIKTADLVGAPGAAAAMSLFDAFLNAHPTATLVFHNANFDIRHIRTAYEDAGRLFPVRTVIDTKLIPVRLRLDGSSPSIRLATLAARYNAKTTLTDIPTAKRRLHKAQQDAQDTAEVLSWLLAEASALGIVSFDDFMEQVKASSSDDHGKYPAHPRDSAPQGPEPATAGHIRSSHSKRGLSRTPTDEQLQAWKDQVAACVGLHCPHTAEKVKVEAQREGLLALLTPLLASCTSPGDVGTLLGAMEPLFARMDRATARAWYRSNHKTIKAAPACSGKSQCPDCAWGNPCPKDMSVILITRRALDYGTTPGTGKPVSLLSRRVKDDLWDKGRHRKVDTWPNNDMHDMAAYMMWMVICEAQRKHEVTTARRLIMRAVAKSLHERDPRLALEVAKYWTTQPQGDTAIQQLVAKMSKKATTDPGYLELAIWADGPFARMQAAREAAAKRKARPAPKGKRAAAPVELRPLDVEHNYRFHRPRIAPVAVQQPPPPPAPPTHPRADGGG